MFNLILVETDGERSDVIFGGHTAIEAQLECNSLNMDARMTGTWHVEAGKPVHQIMTPDGWLWYAKYQGKVRREWVSDICRKAGVDPMKLERGVWHKLEPRSG